MTYQQASARVLDRIRLNNRRRNHLVANPDDAEFERSDERDDELAAEQAAGDAAVNEIVAAIPPHFPSFIYMSERGDLGDMFRSANHVAAAIPW